MKKQIIVLVIRHKLLIFGIGAKQDELKDLIKQLKVEDTVELLRFKNNSYIYMRDCDIYVQPSLHKGYYIILAEARCFNNPIISAGFTVVRV